MGSVLKGCIIIYGCVPSKKGQIGMIPRRRLVAKKTTTHRHFLYDEFVEVYPHETCPPHLDDPSEKVDWA